MVTSEQLLMNTGRNASDAYGNFRNDVRRRVRQSARGMVLPLMLCLSGCVTNAMLPDPSPESSVIDYTRNLEQTTSTLLDKVVVALPNPGQDHADYTSWGSNWCPRHEAVHSVQDVKREISRFCQKAGGVYNDAFCRRASGNDEVLFYAAVLPEGNCQQVANPVGVKIIEPKAGKTTSPEYLAVLHRVGYRTQGDIAVASAEHQRDVQREQERITRELPLLRTRGTRVCNRQQAGTTFVGFVEDVSGEKIRISVQAAYYTNLLGIQGASSKADNYQPQMVWDMPEHWSVCE